MCPAMALLRTNLPRSRFVDQEILPTFTVSG